MAQELGYKESYPMMGLEDHLDLKKERRQYQRTDH